MDEQIVYPAQAILAEDVLKTNRNAVIALGAILEMVLGSGSLASGFVATPGGGLTVSVSQGSMTYLGVVDSTAYGVLAADQRLLVRAS